MKSQIKLIDDAVVGQGCYFAKAEIIDGCIDQEKKEVTVYWDLIEFDGGEEVTDESEACNWGSPDGAKYECGGEWIADKFDGVNDYAGYTIEYFNTDGTPL